MGINVWRKLEQNTAKGLPWWSRDWPPGQSALPLQGEQVQSLVTEQPKIKILKRCLLQRKGQSGESSAMWQVVEAPHGVLASSCSLLPWSSFSQSFDAVLEALSRGEPVDLSRLPPPPGEDPTLPILQDCWRSPGCSCWCCHPFGQGDPRDPSLRPD